LFATCKNIGVNYNKACYFTQSILGTWKHKSSILAGLFIRHQHGSNSYVASYAPLATALMTNKNPAQLLDAYLFSRSLNVPSTCSGGTFGVLYKNRLDRV